MAFRIQYSLATLLALTAFIALLCGWARTVVDPGSSQKTQFSASDVRDRIDQAGGILITWPTGNPSAPGYEIYLTEEFVGDTDVALIPPGIDVDTLSLRRSRLTDAGVACLTQLARIKHLDLSDTKVTDMCIRPLLQIKGLESLNVSGTQIHGNGLYSLAVASGITELDVTKCNIDLRTLTALSQLPGLQLETSDTDFSPTVPNGTKLSP